MDEAPSEWRARTFAWGAMGIDRAVITPKADVGIGREENTSRYDCRKGTWFVRTGCQVNADDCVGTMAGVHPNIKSEGCAP